MRDKKLFKSGYEGVITETGVGVPLQSSILAKAGASNFLLMGLTPYNQVFQPKIGDRSVSEKMAVTMAQMAFNQAKNLGFPRQNKKLFSMAVSGTHSVNPGSESHAWLCLVTEDQIYVGHAVVYVSTRNHFIKRIGHIAVDFLEAALLGGNCESTYFDVLRWPNQTLKDKIQLINSGPTIIYIDSSGNMQRPADIIRKTRAVYRGSFNPPTNAHLDIGGDALMEISCVNARKGSVDINDLVHRVNMLNLLGRGVLITTHAPRFVQLHHILKSKGGDDAIEYVMGADTFNKVCEDAVTDYLGDKLPLSKMNLVVNNRNQIKLHNMANTLNIRVIDRQNDYSSTLARAGDHSGLSPVISDYIATNKLYQ